jgi:hypothetical protein
VRLAPKPEISKQATIHSSHLTPPPPPKKTPHTHPNQVAAGDGQGVPVGRISREDVASLCVASLESAKAARATLSVVSTTARKPGKIKGKGGKVTTPSSVLGGGGAGRAAAQVVADAGGEVAGTDVVPPKEQRPSSPVAGAAGVVSSGGGGGGGGNGDALWPYKLLLRREGRPDETPLRSKPHRLAVAVFVVAVSVLSVGVAAAVAQAMGLVLARMR